MSELAHKQALYTIEQLELRKKRKEAAVSTEEKGE